MTMTIKFGDHHFDDDAQPLDAPAEFRGVLKTWIADRQYGFLARDDGGPDVFVHRHAFIGAFITEPIVGMRVIFQMFPDRSGRPSATNLKLEP
jgi:cold shock CspA family protein